MLCFCSPQVIDLAMEDKKDKLFAMLEKVNVLHKLKSEDKELIGKPLMKRVMQVSTPAGGMGVLSRGTIL